ncbi:hypothetical protein HYT04_01705 [Candidatus Kaiserbacteria bacterium]|nr:hypothetical protein [Candidatus Kaiserbacteria bacterium]
MKMKTVLQRFSLRTVDDVYESRGPGIRDIRRPNFLNICCSSNATDRLARDLISCTAAMSSIASRCALLSGNERAWASIAALILQYELEHVRIEIMSCPTFFTASSVALFLQL